MIICFFSHIDKVIKIVNLKIKKNQIYYILETKVALLYRHTSHIRSKFHLETYGNSFPGIAVALNNPQMLI